MHMQSSNDDQKMLQSFDGNWKLLWLFDGNQIMDFSLKLYEIEKMILVSFFPHWVLCLWLHTYNILIKETNDYQHLKDEVAFTLVEISLHMVDKINNI
jgi:hypothetical protein